MEIRSKLWESNGYGHYTKLDNMYMDMLSNLNVDNFSNVLEIGPGTGEFAKMVIGKYDPIEYYILDLPENIGDASKTLTETGINFFAIEANNHEYLFDKKYDLLVSNICIPETPKEYREKVLNNIIPNCNNAMIIGQLEGNWDIIGNYKEWILDLFNKNFSEVKQIKTSYRNCIALIGMK